MVTKARKMMVVMILVMEGAVLGFEMRVALQVGLRVERRGVGVEFNEVVVVGVCGCFGRSRE